MPPRNNTRKHDTQFRDARLNLVHAGWDIPFPSAGMVLPMVEYDRGRPVAVVNYLRRGDALPYGPAESAAYAAMGQLRRSDDTVMPFITAQYDPRNWAFRLFGHNDAAHELMGTKPGTWIACTEDHFVRLLYRMRGRKVPRLSSYGIELSTAPWLVQEGAGAAEDWPGQAMSKRRRQYEPEGVGVTFNMLNPCADMDLAVVGRTSGTLALIVDYKLEGAHIDPRHKTHQAMGSIRTGGAGHRLAIPSMIVAYDPTGDAWRFQVWCLNEAAERLLAGILVFSGAVAPGWRPNGWTYVDERRWVDLLEEAARC